MTVMGHSNVFFHVEIPEQDFAGYLWEESLGRIPGDEYLLWSQAREFVVIFAYKSNVPRANDSSKRKAVV